MLGQLGKHKWENAMTLLKNSWGIRRDSQIDEYLTVNEMLRELASTVRFVKNIL
jgi:alpha-L-fucosidase